MNFSNSKATAWLISNKSELNQLSSNKFSNLYENLSLYNSYPNFIDLLGNNIDLFNKSTELSASLKLDDNLLQRYCELIVFELEFDEKLDSLLSTFSFFNDSAVSAFDFSELTEYIEASATINNDLDKLEEVFPGMEKLLGELDAMSRYNDDLLDEVAVPDTKLYYPEPFIASPNFVHEEIWFIHILHYQHWLWFMFISIIMFYFITFINVVRWCNPRVRPKRETRGVSRSKCADLITACVPLTWAAAIIISETVDAADYNDGYGTGEIVVGIRAYQWGWEYFYPKGIDLSYNVKPSYSTMVGNSLKYNNTSSTNLDTSSLWRSYRSKTTQNISTSPAHVILSPGSRSTNLNLLDFSKVGLSTVSDSSAFKKIQYFSKVNPHSIYASNASLESKYAKLSDLYLNSSATSSAYTYGTKRQHNFTLPASRASAQPLDANSVSRLMDYNYGVKQLAGKPNFAKENSTIGSNNTRLNYNLSLGSLLLGDYSGIDHKVALDSTKVTNTTPYNVVDTKAKKHSNVVKYTNKQLATQLTSLAGEADLPTNNASSKPTSSITNNNLTFKFKDYKSPNMGFLSSEKNVRLINELNPTKFNPSLTPYNNNLDEIVSSAINDVVVPSTPSLYNLSSLGWASQANTRSLLSSDTAPSTSHTPAYSSNPHWVNKSFDRYLPGQDDLTPNLLKSKEETAPEHLFTTYWKTNWANTPYVHRINSIILNDQILNLTYLPEITEYSDYDFRNWQSLELLEDAFWESTFSSFAQEEYVNILQTNKEYEFFKKQEELFNLTTRVYKFKKSKAYRPFTKSLYFDNSLVNSLAIYADDNYSLPAYMDTNSFHNLPLESSLDVAEDSADTSKESMLSQQLSNKVALLLNTNHLGTASYSKILDPFRADYEEQVWSSDDVSNDSDLHDNLDESLDLKISNQSKLRSTAKNSIVTYNAIQKVLKSRLDEGRSHARLSDFSSSYLSQPFVTSAKSPYEAMLAKNKESFFVNQAYNNYYSGSFNSMFTIWNSLNSTLLDIPFLVSTKSDPSRYLWFDWQSRWSSIEIQPSSIARYSLSGVPYTNKVSEFDTQSGNELADSENYLTRLSRSRKNYMSNWAYTPYFYARSTSWYKKNSIEMSSYDSLQSTKALLKLSNAYWSSKALSTNLSLNYTSSFSGMNSPTRSSSQPSFGMGGYQFHLASLIDLLSKREYMYRSYYNSKGYIATLPMYLTASPANPLIDEIKSGYALIDPVVYSSEVSREALYQNTNFIKFTLIKDLLHQANSTIESSGLNLSGLNNYLFFYMFGFDKSNLGNNSSLWKSQYRPMRKGVTNMVRLQATGAIAMPIEIRLHIMASSRDVIHSWAIPSAGIKIDCVPGYSSHRITIFLVTGIFWGQCMEICGRFHHWMPIVVYFMKRDLFFLWCTHFMHYSTNLDLFDLTDKQLADRLKLLSYDKTSWVNDINKMF